MRRFLLSFGATIPGFLSNLVILNVVYLGSLCLCSVHSSAQSRATSITKAYIEESDGLVHLAYADGRNVTVEKEKEQVSCRDPKIAPDKQTVGWLVNYSYCCTSYPIPLTLVIYRRGKVVQRFSPGQAIFDWRFRQKNQVVTMSGPLHGPAQPDLRLYNIGTGSLLEEWRGDEGDTPPAWGKELRY